MPLINCIVHLEMTWIKNGVLSSDRDCAIFRITDAKLYVPIVTFSTEDNVKLTKQLRNRFKRSVYWNEYKTVSAKVINNEANIYRLLSATFQGVRRLFVLSYDATNRDDAGIKNNRKFFLPRTEIKNYNMLIDGRSTETCLKKRRKQK